MWSGLIFPKIRILSKIEFIKFKCIYNFTASPFASYIALSLLQKPSCRPMRFGTNEACSGTVDLFFFGFYEYRTVDDDKCTSKPRSLAIKNIIQSRDPRKNSILNLGNSHFKDLRLSIIDTRYGKIWQQNIARRTGILMSEKTVKEHYMRKGRCKISLNDQLDDFYEGCKNNTIGDECAYYFHAKRLNPTELVERLKTYQNFRSKHMINEGGFEVPKWRPPWIRIEKIWYRIKSWGDKEINDFSIRNQILLLLADETLITQNPFENMENNEYLFWNGFRLTLTIPPKFALSLNEDKMDNSIKKLNPCLYISLWRSSRPRDYVDIPTPKATKIIGLDTASKLHRSNRRDMAGISTSDTGWEQVQPRKKSGKKQRR